MTSENIITIGNIIEELAVLADNHHNKDGARYSIMRAIEYEQDNAVTIDALISDTYDSIEYLFNATVTVDVMDDTDIGLSIYRIIDGDFDSSIRYRTALQVLHNTNRDLGL